MPGPRRLPSVEASSPATFSAGSRPREFRHAQHLRADRHPRRGHGVAVDRHGDIEGHTVSFVTIRQDSDLAPLLVGLPDGRCHCPHWGYMFAGTVTFHFADHDEIYQPGEAFVVLGGHTPAASAGSEFVMFSPAEQLAEVTAAMAAQMQRMMQGTSTT